MKIGKNERKKGSNEKTKRRKIVKKERDNLNGKVNKFVIFQTQNELKRW